MNKQRKVLITITYNEMGIIIDTKAEEVAQPNLQPTCNQLVTDCISRQQAIDAVNAATVITNPENFKGHEKFTEFMEDEDISSFGKWERANGFNTALVETRILLGKLPSAQPEKTCCGYDEKELIAFAIACRRAGVDEKDLKNFAQDCEFAWRVMQEEFESKIREAFEKWTGGKSDAN